MKDRSWLWPVFIAFFAAALCYLHNDIYIDFADEGFLWYGSQQLLRGQMPIRDFQSYEPGKYFWCAAVFSLFGQGLMKLRLAAGLFQFLGVSLGLLALRRVSRHPLFLLASGLLAVSWMLIPCRYFDASMAMMALFFAVRLVEKPSGRRYLTAGIFTGLAAFFGLNHGLYVSGAFTALSFYLGFKGCGASLKKKYLLYLSGIFLGLTPLWVLICTVPGFGESYWEHLLTIVSMYGGGRANVSLPIPWPWLVSWNEISRSLPAFSGRLLEFLNRFSIGVMFVFTIGYYLVAIFAVARLTKIQERARALFTASVFVGYFYIGHIFARSDLNYLAEGVFPVWAGLLALWSFSSRPVVKRIVLGFIVLFAAGSFFSAGLRNTIVFKNMVPKGAMTWYPVGTDRIWVLRDDAKYIEDVKALVSKYVRPEEPILLAPLLTTFYCLLQKESPVYELYFYFSPLRSVEERMVRDLDQKKVRWAIVGNVVPDGHPEQALRHSHPLLWGYLAAHFEPVTGEGLRPGHLLMKRKS